MDDQRSADPLTLAIDREIDREIDAALMVGPSPEFLARVRARIASEPAPSTWRLPWVFAAASAMALVIVVTMMRVNQTAPVGQAALLLSRPFATDPFALVPTVLSPRLSHPETAIVASRFSRTRSLTVAGQTEDVASGLSRTEPEVLIDAGESAALRRLLAGVGEGRFDLRSLPELAGTMTALGPPREIAIEPLVIEPLELMVNTEGVRP